MINILLVTQKEGLFLSDSLLHLINRKMDQASASVISSEQLLSAQELPGKDLIIFFMNEGSQAKVLKNIQLFREDNSKTPILVIYTLDIEGDMIKEIFKYGRVGFLSIWNTSEEISDSIALQIKTGHVLCPVTKETLLEKILFEKDDTPALQNIEFNQVENEIIEAAGRGLSIRQTAEELGLSYNTIATYRSRILKKTGHRSLISLVVNGGRPLNS